jgi:hypothetical protein
VGPGWLVTNRMKAWQGSVGISSHRGIVSGHYICFRPKHDEVGDYLNWLLRSNRYVAGYQTLSRGVRPGQAEIDNDLLRTLQVVVPPTDSNSLARVANDVLAVWDQYADESKHPRVPPRPISRCSNHRPISWPDSPNRFHRKRQTHSSGIPPSEGGLS